MKTAAVLCAVLMLTLSMGCGDGQVINGEYHDTYGLFNAPSNKDPDVCYRAIVGNIVWSVIGIETVILPVYFIGFSMYEPIPDEDCTPYQRKERGE
jgi:hypothetical protein